MVASSIKRSLQVVFRTLPFKLSYHVIKYIKMNRKRRGAW